MLLGERSVEGRWVGRVVGIEGVRADNIAIVQTPDGNGRLELTKFHSPSLQGDKRYAPANTPGVRHVAFAVEDIDAVIARLRARGTVNWSASRSAMRTATGSATSAARRVSSSSSGADRVTAAAKRLIWPIF